MVICKNEYYCPANTSGLLPWSQLPLAAPNPYRLHTFTTATAPVTECYREKGTLCQVLSVVICPFCPRNRHTFYHIWNKFANKVECYVCFVCSFVKSVNKSEYKLLQNFGSGYVYTYSSISMSGLYGFTLRSLSEGLTSTNNKDNFVRAKKV